MPVPSYLADYRELYAADPRQAAVGWFRDARYGLFLHYGLYSLLGRHEWVMYGEKIRPAEYAKLKDGFTARGFNADAIAALAVDAGMKYVNITTRHHDCFCLFATKQTDFNSVNSPARRDLVGELAAACAKRGLGLCLYYSHGRDWKHPHAPNNDEYGGAARPAYDPPETSYACGKEHDLRKYLDFMTAQITELLTQYGPIASIWLDGIMVPLSDKRKTPCPAPPSNPANAPQWHCQELYDLIHRLQPQVLVSYKQGLLGTEDYFAPEHKAIDNPSGKPAEICTTMCDKPKISWGYLEAARGLHKTADQVWDTLRYARQHGFNLLLNTGPLPDGAVDPEDEAILRQVGRRLTKEGFPR